MARTGRRRSSPVGRPALDPRDAGHRERAKTARYNHMTERPYILLSAATSVDGYLMVGAKWSLSPGQRDPSSAPATSGWQRPWVLPRRRPARSNVTPPGSFVGGVIGRPVVRPVASDLATETSADC